MAGSVIPLIVVLMGFLVRFGVLDNRFYAGDGMFAFIAAGFIVCAAVDYYFVLIRKIPPLSVYLALTILFHVFAVLFLLFVSGVFSPFLIGWIILAVVADVYFGTVSTFLSMLVLSLTALVQILLHPNISAQEQMALFTALVFMVAICFVLSRLRETSDQERADLARTRDNVNFQRERLLALVNSMGDAVVTTDEQGKIKVYNAATLGLLDTNQDLTDKTIDEILQLKDSHGAAVSIMQTAHKQNKVFSRNDLVHEFKDGESMNIYMNVAPVQPGYHAEGERGYIFILRDITKEKSLEEERDEFISVVSHELRTPVAIAEGTISNLQLLQDRRAARPMIADAAKQAHDQILYLAKLVNDLSTLSRAERNVGGEVELIDLTATLQDIYKKYEPQATAKKLQLNIHIPGKLPKLRTSRLYLEEILQNLITNALKYTHEGAVTISAMSGADGLRISVKDSGIGISKYDQKRIFQKFYRSEDYRTRETSGTGLGLYVCKKLAEKLHVKIEFESRLNHGSTFTLVIPKAQLITDAPASAVSKPLPAGFVATK